MSSKDCIQPNLADSVYKHCVALPLEYNLLNPYMVAVWLQLFLRFCLLRTQFGNILDASNNALSDTSCIPEFLFP
jgi:hypothetical protein